MPLNADLLADNPAALPTPKGPVTYGQRPAQILGGVMLVALAFATLLRWTGDGPATLETFVQQQIPADAVSSPSVDLTAPDPGDSPP